MRKSRRNPILFFRNRYFCPKGFHTLSHFFLCAQVKHNLVTIFYKSSLKQQSVEITEVKNKAKQDMYLF